MTDAQKVKIYEDRILAMEGRVFYCEDDEGVLRRWFPFGLIPSAALSSDTQKGGE